MSEALIILFVLAFWILVLFVVGAILRARAGPPTVEETRLEELRARYARGELTSHEYERQRERVEREPDRRAGCADTSRSHPTRPDGAVPGC